MNKRVVFQNKRTGSTTVALVRQMPHDKLAFVGQSGAPFGHKNAVIIAVAGDPPTLEDAFLAVQRDADKSMLAQHPYAYYVGGFGWMLESVTAAAPLPIFLSALSQWEKVDYAVSVLPRRYFAHVGFAIREALASVPGLPDLGDVDHEAGPAGCVCGAVGCGGAL